MVLVSHNSRTWRTYTQKTNTNQIKQMEPNWLHVSNIVILEPQQ